MHVVNMPYGNVKNGIMNSFTAHIGTDLRLVPRAYARCEPPTITFSTRTAAGREYGPAEEQHAGERDEIRRHEHQGARA